MPVGINHFIFLSAVMFGLGIYSIISHKNIIKIFFGILLLLSASLINFMSFSNFNGFNPEGQIIIFILSILCILLTTVGILLAYNYHKKYNSLELDND